MEHRIEGLHHITAIAGAPQANYNFYTKVLGLRFVKKTVNFDDPGTYHFYYGNEQGSPGTILTFFPWAHVKRGTTGNGMVSEISYSVPSGSLAFWEEWFVHNGVEQEEPVELFGEAVLRFRDADGLRQRLIEPTLLDDRKGWTTQSIDATVAVKGFHSPVLRVRELDPTARVLTDIFGYTLEQQSGSTSRFMTEAVSSAAIVDIEVDPEGRPSVGAGGTTHHVAFRVKDEATLEIFREKVLAHGLQITPKIDRNYFYSLYFREPGGILFEIATDNPGFAVDEPLAELGTQLKLPAQYEAHRERIQSILPELKQ